MPYACLLFEDAVNISMRETANRLAANSAFVPQETPFHIPLLGSLHVYSPEAVAAAFPETATLFGRFGRWEIRAGILRATVELDGAEMLVGLLQETLPKGKPWKSFYVALGSVANIEASQHADFLEAVATAFPIDANATFATAARLEYHNVPTTNATTNATSTLNPLAPPFDPAAGEPRLAPPPAQKQKKTRRPSPHKKWARAAAANQHPHKAEQITGTIDALIRKNAGSKNAKNVKPSAHQHSSTGPTGHGTASGTGKRASSAKQKAAAKRQVWVAAARQQAMKM